MSDETGLYGLPFDEFIPARDALVKRLRADGDRDGAAAVAALRKPSVAAWAANQAIRSQPKAARELWAAGDALIEAHAAVVSRKKSAPDLRDATARQRAALRPLVEAASCLLDHHGKGMSKATVEKVADTLHAASLEPALREEAVAGRLRGEHRHTGLGVS